MYSEHIYIVRTMQTCTPLKERVPRVRRSRNDNCFLVWFFFIIYYSAICIRLEVFAQLVEVGGLPFLGAVESPSWLVSILKLNERSLVQYLRSMYWISELNERSWAQPTNSCFESELGFADALYWCWISELTRFHSKVERARSILMLNLRADSFPF